MANKAFFFFLIILFFRFPLANNANSVCGGRNSLVSFCIQDIFCHPKGNKILSLWLQPFDSKLFTKRPLIWMCGIHITYLFMSCLSWDLNMMPWLWRVANFKHMFADVLCKSKLRMLVEVNYLTSCNSFEGVKTLYFDVNFIFKAW